MGRHHPVDLDEDCGKQRVTHADVHDVGYKASGSITMRSCHEEQYEEAKADGDGDREARKGTRVGHQQNETAQEQLARYLAYLPPGGKVRSYVTMEMKFKDLGIRGRALPGVARCSAMRARVTYSLFYTKVRDVGEARRGEASIKYKV